MNIGLHKPAIIYCLGLFIIFLVFARSPLPTMRLWLAFFTMFFLPGYLFLGFFKDMSEEARPFLANIVSFVLFFLPMYYLSVLRFKMIRVGPILFVSLGLCLFFLFLQIILRYKIKIASQAHSKTS
jgi:Na+-driven multidrug efflux pump